MNVNVAAEYVNESGLWNTELSFVCRECGKRYADMAYKFKTDRNGVKRFEDFSLEHAQHFIVEYEGKEYPSIRLDDKVALLTVDGNTYVGIDDVIVTDGARQFSGYGVGDRLTGAKEIYESGYKGCYHWCPECKKVAIVKRLKYPKSVEARAFYKCDNCGHKFADDKYAISGGKTALANPVKLKAKKSGRVYYGMRVLYELYAEVDGVYKKVTLEKVELLSEH